jgi:hypothetical protein
VVVLERGGVAAVADGGAAAIGRRRRLLVAARSGSMRLLVLVLVLVLVLLVLVLLLPLLRLDLRRALGGRARRRALERVATHGCGCFGSAIVPSKRVLALGRARRSECETAPAFEEEASRR